MNLCSLFPLGFKTLHKYFLFVLIPYLSSKSSKMTISPILQVHKLRQTLVLRPVGGLLGWTGSGHSHLCTHLSWSSCGVLRTLGY